MKELIDQIAEYRQQLAIILGEKHPILKLLSDKNIETHFETNAKSLDFFKNLCTCVDISKINVFAQEPFLLIKFEICHFLLNNVQEETQKKYLLQILNDAFPAAFWFDFLKKILRENKMYPHQEMFKRIFELQEPIFPEELIELKESVFPEVKREKKQEINVISFKDEYENKLLKDVTEVLKNINASNGNDVLANTFEYCAKNEFKVSANLISQVLRLDDLLNQRSLMTEYFKHHLKVYPETILDNITQPKPYEKKQIKHRIYAKWLEVVWYRILKEEDADELNKMRDSFKQYYIEALKTSDKTMVKNTVKMELSLLRQGYPEQDACIHHVLKNKMLTLSELLEISRDVSHSDQLTTYLIWNYLKAFEYTKLAWSPNHHFKFEVLKEIYQLQNKKIKTDSTFYQWISFLELGVLGLQNDKAWLQNLKYAFENKFIPLSLVVEEILIPNKNSNQKRISPKELYELQTHEGLSVFLTYLENKASQSELVDMIKRQNKFLEDATKLTSHSNPAPEEHPGSHLVRQILRKKNILKKLDVRDLCFLLQNHANLVLEFLDPPWYKRIFAWIKRLRKIDIPTKFHESPDLLVDTLVKLPTIATQLLKSPFGKNLKLNVSHIAKLIHTKEPQLLNLILHTKTYRNLLNQERANYKTEYQLLQAVTFALQANVVTLKGILREFFISKSEANIRELYQILTLTDNIKLKKGQAKQNPDVTIHQAILALKQEGFASNVHSPDLLKLFEQFGNTTIHVTVEKIEQTSSDSEKHPDPSKETALSNKKMKYQ